MRIALAEITREDTLTAPIIDWTRWLEGSRHAARALYKEIPIDRYPPHPVEQDIAFLWDYAQAELIAALLHAGSCSSVTAQDRIFDAHERYFAALVQHYLLWRREKWETVGDGLPSAWRLSLAWRENVKTFLVLKDLPRFILPETRGGSRSNSLDQAAQDFFLLRTCLRQKQGRRFRDHQEKKLKIMEAIAQMFFGVTDLK